VEVNDKGQPVIDPNAHVGKVRRACKRSYCSRGMRAAASKA
jgi:hypothetical protein